MSEQLVKCLIWDLDDTLWEGILVEGGGKRLREGVLAVLQELDRRGILLSIASKNDSALALENLRSLGVDEYFLHPQISWGPKSAAVSMIADSLNIGIDSLAFIDDQGFERDEVAQAHPQVTCYDARAVSGLLDLPELRPPVVTADASRRREMYRATIRREAVEESFEGTPDEFLRTLGMHLTIRRAGTDDLARAEELTVRTHQLNSTGVTYSRDELERFIDDPCHLVLVCDLEDRYGTYGTVGLCVLRRDQEDIRILLLLMSCRVMSRGTGAQLLRHLQRGASEEGCALAADFVPTDRNRIMYVTYRFADFQELGEKDGKTLLVWWPADVPPVPDYLRLSADDGWWSLTGAGTAR